MSFSGKPTERFTVLILIAGVLALFYIPDIWAYRWVTICVKTLGIIILVGGIWLDNQRKCA